MIKIEESAELEDDVYELMQSNEQVEVENRELMGAVEEIEFTLQEQNTHISELKTSIVRSAKASSHVLSYEERVSSLGSELRELQTCALEHKELFERLLGEKREAEVRRSGLMIKIEESAKLERRVVGETYLLVHQKEMGEEVSLEVWQLAEELIEFSRQIEKRIEERQQQVETVSKELNLQLIREKERHIALDYRLQLLRARERDREKQEAYLAEGFSQNMLQKEIDDLVVKRQYYEQQIHEQA